MNLTQDPDKFQKYGYSLNDWAEVTEVEVSSEAIAQIASLYHDAAKINCNHLSFALYNLALQSDRRIYEFLFNTSYNADLFDFNSYFLINILYSKS